MNFRILYTIPSDNHVTVHETQWVCLPGYTTDKALQSFQQQNTTAAVIQVRELTELPTPDTTAAGR